MQNTTRCVVVTAYQIVGKMITCAFATEKYLFYYVIRWLLVKNIPCSRGVKIPEEIIDINYMVLRNQMQRDYCIELI